MSATPPSAILKARVITSYSIHYTKLYDIHFDYRLALQSLEAGVAGLRLNPGNIGARWKVEEVVAACRERAVPIRIGVNAGSLEKELLEKYGHPTAEAMVESALGHIRILEELNYREIT